MTALSGRQVGAGGVGHHAEVCNTTAKDYSVLITPKMVLDTKVRAEKVRQYSLAQEAERKLVTSDGEVKVSAARLSQLKTLRTLVIMLALVLLICR